MSPKLLDLFCGSGGAATGYSQAGFDVYGVDIKPQPYYPFWFLRADAIEHLVSVDPSKYDFIHASPPCQAYSSASPAVNDHPDLVGLTRDWLVATGVPYVIENVPQAPMRRDLMLCGSMFGLEIQRHRIFEFGCGASVDVQPSCEHRWKEGRPWSVVGNAGGTLSRSRSETHSFKYRNLAHAQELMEMPWVRTRKGITEAVHPAYTRFIGLHVLLPSREG